MATKSENAVFWGISYSGETREVIQLIKRAKEQGKKQLASLVLVITSFLSLLMFLYLHHVRRKLSFVVRQQAPDLLNYLCLILFLAHMLLLSMILRWSS